jgi:hypothetical protein
MANKCPTCSASAGDESIPPLLVTPKEAARLLSLSIRKIAYLGAEKRIERREIDGSVRYAMSDLIAFSSKNQTRENK